MRLFRRLFSLRSVVHPPRRAGLLLECVPLESRVTPTASFRSVMANFCSVATISIAMVASVANERSAATAAKGITAGSGPGVEGSSAHGVGGRFEGSTAQVHLVPSAASAHPAVGSPGQLFVDHSNRLWYCNGGTTWKQLA